MIESVFREIVGKKLLNYVEVQEALPNKGKPAQRENGARTVWVIKASLGNEEILLESSRGGAREWASLNSLDNWIRHLGIQSYSVNHMSHEKLLQQQLFMK